MILHALNDYYDRLHADSDIQIAESGFSTEKISAVIVLDKNGKLVQFKDIRQGEGKKLTPVEMIVPQSISRPGSKAHEKPFFLWDNTGFVLGDDGKDQSGKAILKFENFKKLHNKILKDCSDDEAKTLLSFINNWTVEDAKELDGWEELAGCNVVFQMDGARTYLHNNSTLCKLWMDAAEEQNSAKYIDGNCCITGKLEKIPNIHPVIKGVRGAQSSGAAIVSFNASAYESYNKQQNYNASIGKDATFGYTTALNHMLASKNQRILIGDTTTVFWTERQSLVENIFGQLINPSDSDIVDNGQIADFLQAAKAGSKLPDVDESLKFYVLGLSPNASRVSIRFWHVDSIEGMREKLGQHFRDLEMVKSRGTDPEFPPLWKLLVETKNKNSSDGASPLLSGAVMQSIVEGTIYPQSLLSAVIGRIRADQEINYLRASIIKAILVRRARIFNRNELEVKMSLDKENKTSAYLLGRLFAVLEKAQKDAIPGANSTIKDRYFASASATPRVVFPQLIRLSQHHISKADYGYTHDKRIEEILCDISEFPAHLSIEQQGVFAIGYYHQRQNLYSKKEA